MDFDDSIDEMNILLGDTENVTFTPEEKIRAMTKAWNDPWVIDDVWSTAGLFSVSNYQTALPDGLTTVKDIGVRGSTSDFPDSIDSNYYSVVGSNIQWSQGARYGLTDGTGLFILGSKKLTVSDTITSESLKEYVISLGALNTLTHLGYKKANLFLKNDVTMGELITLKREMEKDVKEMRARFAKNFQDI